jgi:hypothetical protein
MHMTQRVRCSASYLFTIRCRRDGGFHQPVSDPLVEGQQKWEPVALGQAAPDADKLRKLEWLGLEIAVELRFGARRLSVTARHVVTIVPPGFGSGPGQVRRRHGPHQQ